MSSREERRAFLERSLADLDEEHAAGDLSDEDHARLTADYRRRLDALDASPDDAGDDAGARASGAGPRRQTAPARRNPWLTAAAATFVVGVAIVAGILVAQASGRRDAGDNITGGNPAATDDDGTGATTTTARTATTEPVPEALARCFDLDGGAALDCYLGYTDANPEDPKGFLYFGLYTINQGLQGDRPELLQGGETFLRRALELDPDYVEARANLAVVLERTGRDDEAREQLGFLDGVDLSADVQALVDFVERNLAEG